jgi:hypothetical protein
VSVGSNSRCRAFSRGFQSLESLPESPSRLVLILGKGGLGHGIAPSGDIVRVDIQRDERLNVELLFPDPIFVRVLMEPHGDKLDHNFLTACNEGNDEESKDQALEDVEVGIGRGRGVSDKGVFPVVWPSIWAASAEYLVDSQ